MRSKCGPRNRRSNRERFGGERGLKTQPARSKIRAGRSLVIVMFVVPGGVAAAEPFEADVTSRDKYQTSDFGPRTTWRNRRPVRRRNRKPVQRRNRRPVRSRCCSCGGTASAGGSGASPGNHGSACNGTCCSSCCRSSSGCSRSSALGRNRKPVRRRNRRPVRQPHRSLHNRRGLRSSHCPSCGSASQTPWLPTTQRKGRQPPQRGKTHGSWGGLLFL